MADENLPTLPGDGDQSAPAPALPGGEPGTNENQDTTGVLKPGPAVGTSEDGTFVSPITGQTLEEKHQADADAKAREFLQVEVQARQDMLARVEALSLLPPGSLAEAAIAEMFGPYETHQRNIIGARQAAVNLRQTDDREHRVRAARLDGLASLYERLNNEVIELASIQ